jgi:hypothetical protein
VYAVLVGFVVFSFQVNPQEVVEVKVEPDIEVNFEEHHVHVDGVRLV